MADASFRQEAQLSQRDRAILRVIEYFAKSLKLTLNDTLEKDDKSRLEFRCNYMCLIPFQRSIISVGIMGGAEGPGPSVQCWPP